MKVFLITEGSIGIGFGHITRCISLYDAFLEQGASVELIVNCDRYALSLIQGRDCDIFNWNKDRKRIFDLVKGADIVIVDSYIADEAFYRQVSKNVDMLISIDDYNRLRIPRGYVVSPTIYASKLNYPKDNRLTYLLGRDYIILRKEFWDIPNKEISPNCKNILVTLGGMDHSFLIKGISSFFERKIKCNVLTVNPLKNKLSCKEMLSIMLKADVCISGGGQTLYELARVGAPTIGICLADNQKMNLEAFKKSGFIEYAGSGLEPDLINKIERSFNKITAYSERKKRSAIGQNLVDGLGARRIVNELINANVKSR
ncbi:MAG: glycosyltransferase [Candidatus Omnitrophota bacterium]